MGSVNTKATHKFVIVLNEKSPFGKILSATGQLAMSLVEKAPPEAREQMDFIPFLNNNKPLIAVSTCSFVVLKGTNSQLLTLHAKTYEHKLLSALFTSTMSFNGVEEDLILKTAQTPLEEVELYGVGLFGGVEEINSLTKKFSVFK